MHENVWNSYEKNLDMNSYQWILLISHFRYSSEDFIGDMVAGITVGLTVIPQALAYAGIAGLDPAVSKLFWYTKLTEINTVFFFEFSVRTLWLLHGMLCVYFPRFIQRRTYGSDRNCVAFNFSSGWWCLAKSGAFVIFDRLDESNYKLN